MRLALLTLVIVIGCSKKSETKQEPAGAATPSAEAPAPADKPADDKPADDKPAEDKPGAGPVAAEVPAMTTDCAALLTAADVANACGGSKVDVAEATTPVKVAYAVCSLKMTEPGKKFPIAHVQLLGFADAPATDGWVKLDKTADAKEVAGIGDVAWSRVKQRPALKSTDYDVGVRKGRSVLKLSMSDGLVEKLPCTIDQLTELAKVITARIP